MSTCDSPEPSSGSSLPSRALPSLTLYCFDAHAHAGMDMQDATAMTVAAYAQYGSGATDVLILPGAR
jgi:hypothetical protein